MKQDDRDLLITLGIMGAIVAVFVGFYKITIHVVAVRMKYATNGKTVAAIVAAATKNLETSRRIGKPLHNLRRETLGSTFHKLEGSDIFPVHNSTVEFVRLFCTEYFHSHNIFNALRH